MLQAYVASGQLLLAQNVDKNQSPFTCPGCQQEVRLRQGQVMVSHFAHIRKDQCHYFSENESAEHLGLKSALYNALCGSEKVEVEAPLPELQQVADLLVNERLALEVQCSSLSLERLQERTQAYQAAGFQVLWLLGKKLWLGQSLSALQRQFLLWSANSGFYLWELDLDKQALRLKYLIHEDLHGKVHYLEKQFPFANFTLDSLRFPYQSRELASFTFYEDKQIKTYLQGQLYHRNPKWLAKQESAYLQGHNLLQEPLESFYPQCQPPQSAQGFCQIQEELSSYYENFETYYQNSGYQSPQILYPPAFYAIMKAKKAR